MRTLEKPQPDYRLTTRARRAVLMYHIQEKGFKLPEGSRYDIWSNPASEDLITLEMLKEVQRVGLGHVRDYGKISEIDVANKILCMEGQKEVLISEIESLKEKLKKLEGDRIKYAVDALNEAIIQLEM